MKKKKNQLVFIAFYSQFYQIVCRIHFDTEDSKNKQPYSLRSPQLFGNSTSLSTNVKRNNKNLFTVTTRFVYTSNASEKFQI